MKNYQRVNYKKYYAQDENEKYVEVDRKTCFASADQPTENNSYKQRWFYDEEAGYVVRLSRNKGSEDIHRLSSTSLKREERYRNRKFACIYENTNKCNQECDRCTHDNTSRTVELDRDWSNGNSEMSTFFTPADDSQDIFNILEDRELKKLIKDAFESLSPEDQLLFNCLIERKAKKAVAKLLDITVDGVRYRELQLRKKLLAHKDLKRFLEK